MAHSKKRGWRDEMLWHMSFKSVCICKPPISLENLGIKKEAWHQRGGSAVKYASCFTIGPRFSLQHLCCAAQTASNSSSDRPITHTPTHCTHKHEVQSIILTHLHIDIPDLHVDQGEFLLQSLRQA